MHSTPTMKHAIFDEENYRHPAMLTQGQKSILITALSRATSLLFIWGQDCQSTGHHYGEPGFIEKRGSWEKGVSVFTAPFEGTNTPERGNAQTKYWLDSALHEMISEYTGNCWEREPANPGASERDYYCTQAAREWFPNKQGITETLFRQLRAISRCGITHCDDPVTRVIGV